MKYPKVQHSHIVPRAYLRGFADGERIQMHRVGTDINKPISIRAAAVRTNAYKRTRPNGDVIYDVEWSLSQAEGKALPLIKKIAKRELWDLDDEQKGIVGGFVALQLLRVPRWMNWYSNVIANTHEQLRGRDITSPGGVVLPPVSVERAGYEVRDTFQGDTGRLLRMMHSVNELAGPIFAAMHWTLIEFDDHAIAVSDHPVVPWPREILLSKPEPVAPQGLIDMLEIRVPLASDMALLLTWIDDDADYRTAGTEDQAARFNAFTIASAEEAWFHRPGRTPSIMEGTQVPISLGGDCWGDYDGKAAERSSRRAKLNSWLQDRIGAVSAATFEPEE